MEPTPDEVREGENFAYGRNVIESVFDGRQAGFLAGIAYEREAAGRLAERAAAGTPANGAKPDMVSVTVSRNERSLTREIPASDARHVCGSHGFAEAGGTCPRCEAERRMFDELGMPPATGATGGERQREDYEQTYDAFWRELVETDGALDPDKVKRELHDYSYLLDNVPQVYSHVTDGQVSKPNTAACAVMAVHDDVVTKLCEEAVADDRKEREVPAAQPQAAEAQNVIERENGHEWCEPTNVIHYVHCRRCLKIQRADRQNPPCRGPSGLSLRGSPAASAGDVSPATIRLIDMTAPDTEKGKATVPVSLVSGDAAGGGTWYTIEYAIRQGKPVHLVWPDGQVAVL